MESAEFARKFGLPFSQRKFDRQVSCTDTTRVEFHSSSKKQNENKDKTKLIKSKVFNEVSSLKIFKAKCDKKEPLKSFEHGKILFYDHFIFDSKDQRLILKH